jgi:hypothetical protein
MLQVHFARIVSKQNVKAMLVFEEFSQEYLVGNLE